MFEAFQKYVFRLGQPIDLRATCKKYLSYTPVKQLRFFLVFLVRLTFLFWAPQSKKRKSCFTLVRNERSKAEISKFKTFRSLLRDLFRFQENFLVWYIWDWWRIGPSAHTHIRPPRPLASISRVKKSAIVKIVNLV